MRPMIGALMAPTSSVAVSDHCASLSGTCMSRAIIGTSGAPSDEMIATTSVTKTRVEVSSPARAGVASSGGAHAT